MMSTRDYTKYTVEGVGEQLNKRQLVYSIIADWITKNNPSLEELQRTFPDNVQGSSGCLRKASEVSDAKRYNMREPLKIKNGMHIVVSNQWGAENISNFLDLAKDLGYRIEPNANDIEDESTPRFSLSKQYFPNYDRAWGRVITLQLDNGPSCESIESFKIQIDMQTNEVIGHPDADDALSRWFGEWEVGMYDDYVANESYDGVLYISGGDEEDWCIKCHDAFEEVLEGELPDNVSGEEIYNALGHGEAVYELYAEIMWVCKKS